LAKKKRRAMAMPRVSETPAAEATIVAWMLSVMTTLVCSAVALAVWSLAPASSADNHALLFARYLHFSAVVAAVMSLVLLGFVLKSRSRRPPRSITVFGVLVALLPMLAAFAY